MVRTLTGRSGRIGILLVVALALTRCGTGSNPLAPYEGERPLQFLKVTQSFSPQIQWVGGRVAAVGVNRGTTAALDSTLVWLMTSDDDAIASHVTVGQSADGRAALDFGGVPLDSLDSGGEYTFWLASTSALAAGLDSTRVDEHTFVDTTVTLQYLLRGRSGGDPSLNLDIEVFRNETLLEDTYTVVWTPSTQRFQQMGISKGTLAAFNNLVWHVVGEEGGAASITAPVVIGEPPAGTEAVIAWPDEGFESSTYIIWMATEDWSGEFGFRSPGYAFFQAFSSNFAD